MGKLYACNMFLVRTLETFDNLAARRHVCLYRNAGGLPIRIRGPFGTPTQHSLTDSLGEMILIGTGMGITPFAAIARTHRDRQLMTRVEKHGI